MLKCLLDMDGVLSSFHDGVVKLFNIKRELIDATPKPWPWAWVWDATGITENEFWATIKDEGPEFWSNLPPTSDCFTILRMMESFFGTDNVCLLTDHSGLAESVIGKTEWIAKHVPNYGHRVLFGRAKQFCANPCHYLVDDGEHNYKTFTNAGGKCILVPRPWNRLHALEVLEHLQSELDALSGASSTVQVA